MRETRPNPEQKLKAIKPEKYHWKRSYTYVLVANALYIMFFYTLMILFS